MTEAIEILKAELNRLKADISVRRKGGADTLIAELKTANIASKIKMAEATLSLKDIRVARNLITEAWKEVPKESFNNYSDELLLQMRADIAKAKKDIAVGNKKEAEKIYQKMASVYPLLSLEHKREILPECKEILQALR